MARYPAALAASSSSSSSPARPSSSSSPTKSRASSRRRRNDDLLAHFPFRSRRNKRLANDAAALLAAKRQSARMSRANLTTAIANSDQQQQKTLPPIPPLGRRRNFFKAMQRKRSQPTSGASPPQSSASTSPSSPSSSTSSNSLASSSSITSTDATSLATSASASSSCPLSDRARGVVEAVRVAAPSSATSKLKELSDSKSRTTDHSSQPSLDGSAAGDDSEDSLQRRNRREAAAQNLQRWPWAGDDTFGAEASNPLQKLDPSSPARPSSPEPYGALIAPLVTPPPRQQREQQPPSPVTVYEIASTPPIPQGGLFAPAHDGANHSHWSVSTLGPANRSVLLPSPRIDRPLWLPPPPPGDALKPRRKAVPQAQPPPPPPAPSHSQPKQKMQRQRHQQQQQRSSGSTHVTGLGYLGANLAAAHGSSSIVEEGSCINFEWTSVTDRDEVTMSSIDDDCDAQSEEGEADGLGLDPAIFDSTGTEYGDVVQQPRGAPWHAAQHGQEQRGHWRSRSSIDCDGFGGHHLRTSDLDILSKFEMVSTAAPPKSKPQLQPAFALPAPAQHIGHPSANQPPSPPFEPQIQVTFEAVPPPQCAETMAPSSAIAWTVTVTHNGEEKVVRGQASLESLLPLLPAAQPLPTQTQHQQQQQHQHQQPATPVLLLSPVMEDSTSGFGRERTLSNVSSTSASSAFTSRGQRVRYNSESTDATGTSAATTASSGPRFKPRPFMLSGAGAGVNPGEERCSRLLGEELHERAQRKASLIMARRASSRLTVANVTPPTSAAPSPSPTSSSTLSIPDRSASLAHQQRTSTAAAIRASTLLLRSQYASLASSTTPMPPTRYYGKRPSFAPPVVLGSSAYARERARPYPTAAGHQKLQQPFLLSASASAGGSSRASGVASWRASTYRGEGVGVESRRVCYDVRRHRLEHATLGGLSRGRYGYVPTSSAVCI